MGAPTVDVRKMYEEALRNREPWALIIQDETDELLELLEDSDLPESIRVALERSFEHARLLTSALRAKV